MHDVVFEHLQKRYQHVWYSGLEGDDTLGIMASGEEGSKYIVVSIDKDLLTVPGRHFNPDHPETPPHKVSVHVANYNWLYQTIAGDAVDNYKGAPGAGKVAATKALAGCADAHEMWENVLEVFAAQFDTERWRPKFLTDSPWDEAIMNAQCARILRWGEYNKRDKLVKLWHPDNDNQWISPF